MQLPNKNLTDIENICKNRKLAFYTVDKDVIANLKIPCNVVHIATGHVNNIAMILSKHNPFTDVINFHTRSSLQKYVYNGMMNRLKQRTIKKKSNNMIKHQPVPLISVILLLIFILIGIVLSKQTDSFTIDNCKLCDQKSAIPLYAEAEKEISSIPESLEADIEAEEQYN
ncbi:hypothetical protein HZH68_015014 [Vespula germanica]|uniref:Uncharacterized protein n=1 Tax=Vespula germanica TaxID=30212 RepID=A0A834MSR3_VESGE|nr:hypothetical protein HZH68_015014 [Vespula germanica]